ncbi:outer membrane protein assembly factor BamA [Geobacter sp. DSM 9736]|uniref:outer membrane protein assembly factor BamA n=1 Tax=Geobacter sp. DSM 9736 TaxID=1277350 RepID=UPI000B50CEB2|nr:outer membrane protein assembly factor BamA [Geobacter sp. DSM 9736]SNB45009.1 Beta-barrel assembly machine subunit BamA [Geobacter sp. DSM 9736]
MLNRLFLLLLLLILAIPAAHADDERVVEVLVKGNRRIEAAAIANVLKTTAGSYLFPEQVDEDVRAIFRLGHFQDVKAEISRGDKGTVLTFLVTEKPVVREIRIEGNKEVSTEKIREVLEIRTNTIYSPNDVAKSIKKVKKLYADDGYYLAEIDTRTEKRSANEVRVLLTVKEGDKVLIRKILFEGNRAFSDRKLKKVMETNEKGWFSWLTSSGTYKEEVLKNDANLIADLYYNNGYVNVKVGEPVVTVMPDKRGLEVRIGITEGEQFSVGALGFKGDLLESEAELAKQLKLKTGEIFSRGTLRGDVFTLTDIYADKGYAFANITPLSKADAERKIIDVTFDLEKGEKVYIDRINIGGNVKTRDKVIRREIKLAEGELYSATALKRSKQNLMNLGFFEEANLATARGRADNKLNLNVDVKEKPTGTFSIGGGYSSLDGIIGQGSIQQANFLGLGLKLNAAASIGGKSQTYNLGLTDPYFLDTRWTLGADLYRTERDYLDFTRRVTGGDIKAGYPLSDTVSTFWVYKFEDKKVYNLSAALENNILTGQAQPVETSATTSSVTGSITRNTTDYRLDPSRGMVNNLSVEVAGLGGTSRYARYIGNTTVFFPAWWGTVFSLRGEVGHIQGIGKQVPIDEKFFLGGINTIRGYAGRTVSPVNTNRPFLPVDSSGEAARSLNEVYLGGDTEAFFNAEYQFPLIKDAGLKGVLFFDTGNSFDSKAAVFDRFLSSYGFGIRWFSPMGPLRLEYGIPLNPRAEIDQSGGRLEFSIGGFF